MNETEVDFVRKCQFYGLEGLEGLPRWKIERKCRAGNRAKLRIQSGENMISQPQTLNIIFNVCGSKALPV